MVKYRMVAHTLQDNSLSPAQRQELLLIRANLEEQPKAGGAECKHTETMLEEIKEIFSETQLVDKDGRVVRKSDAVGGTVAEFYGNMDLDTLELKGPEQALYDEFADIKHKDGSPNTMSLDGLGEALQTMHQDAHGAELTNAFKVADLNGDGEVDLEEFLFAVKIRHGAGFEKGQYFITWECEKELTQAQQHEVDLIFAKRLSHPLIGNVKLATRSVLDVLTFKGKNILTGETVTPVRVPSEAAVAPPLIEDRGEQSADDSQSLGLDVSQDSHAAEVDAA